MKTINYTIGGIILLVIIIGLEIYFFKKSNIDVIVNPIIELDNTGVTPQGIQEVVRANNEFSFNLYSQLNKEVPGNIFYSPYSISTALAMTFEGAKGQTAEEMYKVLRFTPCVCKKAPCECDAPNTRRPATASIYNSINKNQDSYQLSTGNALWGQADFPFLPDYTATVEKYYGGKVTNLDFKNETEKSRVTINSYIEKQTNDKIKDLIPSGILDSLTKLVLTNAIYFKGTWQWEFDKKDTRDQDFKVTPSNIVKVPMMYMKPEKANFNYLETKDLQILELPYKGGDLSMLVLLPKENLDAASPSLTPEKLEEYKAQMKETKLAAIYLPKFEFDAKYYMKNTLSALGMPTAFSRLGADFSGMTLADQLCIGEVIHQAYVKVDEQGTEAAAATAVVMMLGSAAPSKAIIFQADHPFIFIIQQKETGNILFMGKMTDPTKK